jgi:hypothetical protein
MGGLRQEAFRRTRAGVGLRRGMMEQVLEQVEATFSGQTPDEDHEAILSKARSLGWQTPA